MRYFKSAKVTRINEDNLKVSFHKEKDSEVSIYLLQNNKETLICKTLEGEVVIKDPNSSIRNLFIIRSEGYHSEIIGEVLIPLKGAHNFRDIGGYKSEDGRRVRWNCFFRSDKLNTLTKEDINFLEDIGIKTILDLRSKHEIKGNRDPYIKGARYINISAMPALNSADDNFDMLHAFYEHFNDSDDDIKEFLMEGYRGMVFNNSAFKKLVDALVKEEAVPIIFHCTSGKDRTGFAAAIILSILGVPPETIMEDYLLSNVYRKAINDKIIEAVNGDGNNKRKVEILKIVLSVQKELLEECFNLIDKKYGGMDVYLEKEFGLTKNKRKELKNIYLY